MVLIEVFREKAEVRAPARRTAVLHGSKALVDVAAACSDHRDFGLGRFLSDDVDHAVDGVRSPNRAARTADHFDALNVLKGNVERVPEDAAEAGRVDAASVDENEELVGESLIETASADGPDVGVDLCDVHAGNHAKDVWDAGGAGAANVFLGDDEDGRGRARNGLLGLRDGDHLHVHEVFEAA